MMVITNVHHLAREVVHLSKRAWEGLVAITKETEEAKEDGFIDLERTD